MVERRDKELEAIATVISALQPLDEAVRARCALNTSWTGQHGHG